MPNFFPRPFQSTLRLAALLLWAATVGATPAAAASGMALQLAPGVGGGQGGKTVTYALAQASATASATASGDSAYRVDAGDSVTVNVFGEPDLSVKAEKVQGDGTISMPLLGSVQVRELTAPQIKAAIEAQLRDGYLKKPSVTVSIDTNRRYFIKGEVRNPGGYSYADGLTIEKAVALAGGYTERASEGAITLVRESDPSRLEKVGPGARVRPGDVVTIGESFF